MHRTRTVPALVVLAALVAVACGPDRATSPKNAAVITPLVGASSITLGDVQITRTQLIDKHGVHQLNATAVAMMTSLFDGKARVESLEQGALTRPCAQRALAIARTDAGMRARGQRALDGALDQARQATAPDSVPGATGLTVTRVASDEESYDCRGTALAIYGLTQQWHADQDALAAHIASLSWGSIVDFFITGSGSFSPSSAADLIADQMAIDVDRVGLDILAGEYFGHSCDTADWGPPY